jgi:hypothetical protein
MSLWQGWEVHRNRGYTGSVSRNKFTELCNRIITFYFRVWSRLNPFQRQRFVTGWWAVLAGCRGMLYEGWKCSYPCGQSWWGMDLFKQTECSIVSPLNSSDRLHLQSCSSFASLVLIIRDTSLRFSDRHNRVCYFKAVTPCSMLQVQHFGGTYCLNLIVGLCILSRVYHQYFD